MADPAAITQTSQPPVPSAGFAEQKTKEAVVRGVLGFYVRTLGL